MNIKQKSNQLSLVGDVSFVVATKADLDVKFISIGKPLFVSRLAIAVLLYHYQVSETRDQSPPKHSSLVYASVRCVRLRSTSTSTSTSTSSELLILILRYSSLHRLLSFPSYLSYPSCIYKDFNEAG